MSQNATSLEGIFEELESKRFAAETRVTASLKVLLSALTRDRSVQALITLLRESPSDIPDVTSRISALLKANDAPDYLHPFDGAVAAYLYALNAVDKMQALGMSSSVLETPQLWWAHQLAKQIIEEAVPSQ